MLNKFLCFMWGHEFDKIVGTVILRVACEVYKLPVTVEKCKHCEARK